MNWEIQVQRVEKGSLDGWMDLIGSPFANHGGGDHNGASKKGTNDEFIPAPKLLPGERN